MKLQFTKQPIEVLDYDVDYSNWLSTGDSIQSATASISPPGLTLSNVQVNGSIAKIWLSGGANDTLYKVTVNLTTTGGRISQEEFYVFVKDL